jgi:hypothetical protein
MSATNTVVQRRDLDYKAIYLRIASAAVKKDDGK